MIVLVKIAFDEARIKLAKKARKKKVLRGIEMLLFIIDFGEKLVSFFAGVRVISAGKFVSGKVLHHRSQCLKEQRNLSLSLSLSPSLATYSEIGHHVMFFEISFFKLLLFITVLPFLF